MKKIHIYDDFYIRLQKPTKFIVIFVTVCLSICAFSIISLHFVKKEYMRKSDELRYEIVKETAKSEYYKVDEKYINSVDFIDRIARQELGMVGKDDILFQVIDKAQMDNDEP